MTSVGYRVLWLCLLLGAVLTVAVAPSALAQESRGSISGTVRDNSGGGLPGVTVTAVQRGHPAPAGRERHRRTALREEQEVGG
jgi:hypothetical protein